MARPRRVITGPRRGPGGQPGNINRLRHGFYAGAGRNGDLAARVLLGRVAMAMADFSAEIAAGEGVDPSPFSGFE